MCILWNKNINLQPIDFQINASSNTFLQFPHLCYHGFFFFGNRLQIVPKIVHSKENKKQKNLPWAVHLLHGATTGCRENWLSLSSGIILIFVTLY